MEKTEFYKILSDSVVQGKFQAKVSSPTSISSNYILGQQGDKSALPGHSNQSEKQSFWNLNKNIARYPSYSSDQLLIDALYNMSLEELVLNTESDGTFRTGALWEGVWTRDISYSILLSLSFLTPEISKTSLRKKVKNGRIVQDTGTGGAYPVSTDRVVWAIAAWEIYLVTGDKAWLEEIFPVIQSTLEDDRYNTFDHETGLIKGESSFLDWREQTYPDWMQPADIYESETLGTNALHFKANLILAEIQEVQGDMEASEKYRKIAETIKNGINDHLWIEHKGYFGQYLYGRTHKILSPRAEALGESLAVLFDIAVEDRQKKVMDNTPVVPYGIPCIFPQTPDIPSYHNNGIWPFVQAYWSLAAAKVGNESALAQSLDGIYRAAALFLTNKENFVADNGDYGDTVKNSDRQLWSVAGHLAMVYKVFFGMKFTQEGLVFKPFVPEKYKGKKKISGFTYRKSFLDLELQGFGNKINSVKLDGKIIKEAKIPIDLEGPHSMMIFLEPGQLIQHKVNLLENAFSPPTPVVKYQDRKLTWERQEGVQYYRILKSGKPFDNCNQDNWEIPDQSNGEYQVIAVGSNGYASFASEPIPITSAPIIEIDLSLFNPSSQSIYEGYTGGGYIAVSPKENLLVEFEIKTNSPGNYTLNIRYSNGSGPINTDNKCALRTLFQNGNLIGTLVFPQRGAGNWEDWGESNGLKVSLCKGSNRFSIAFETHNLNMNGEVNNALLDRVQLVKIE